ncbi:putative armadillo-like helical, importin beta family [Helianthus anomalus]
MFRTSIEKFLGPPLICRALDEKVLPWCDGSITQLLKDLSCNQLHRSVKPPIFSWFGAGIFEGFKNSPKTQLLIPYAPHILQFLDLIYMEKDMGFVEFVHYSSDLVNFGDLILWWVFALCS